MEPNRRVEVVTATVAGIAIISYFLNLSTWPVSLVMEFGVNFIISGVIYVLLREIGFNFLEDIQLGFISAMTIIVFLLKTLLI